MTLTLELTPEQEQRLEREAARRGMDTRDYALSVLLPEESADREYLAEDEEAPLPEPGMMTPAETISYWERHGVLNPRPGLPDSPVYARQ